MNQYAEQPSPIPNDRPSIQSLVRHDLEQREQVGIARYGTPLQPHNGRDALRDAYEEALDLACYLRQAIEERHGGCPGRGSCAAADAGIPHTHVQPTAPVAPEPHPDGGWVAFTAGSGRHYEGPRSATCLGAAHRHDIRCIAADPAGAPR